MIKIKLENPKQVEKEYFEKISSKLIKRITCVKKAIDHLNGFPVNIGVGEIDFIKNATISIIKEIDPDNEIRVGKKYSTRDFNADVYTTSLNTYIQSNNNLNNAQLTRISNLFNKLLLNDSVKLKRLLKCNASQLKNTSNEFTLGLTLPDDLFYIKLAFNYKQHSEIANLVREFFREKNFIEYCPYCNLDKIKYIADSKENAAASHDLDHFFDKARFPLLCYSIYNLVPSDTTCNQTNKGTIEFTNDYHLNPYLDGFNKSLIFTSVLSGVRNPRYKVVLKSEVNQTSPEYKRIFGKYSHPDDKSFGNVNAFKLKARYEDETHQALFIASKLDLHDKGYLYSITKYFKLLAKGKLSDSYMKYYEYTFATPFDEVNFQNFKYAKFNRDLHDQYFDLLFGDNKSMKKRLEYIFYKK
ncbi:hypothetical protein [Leeuwenhoekiella sp. ZYFB001]|uniref:hypothetical protein n=1 Tax=Leeuwenhoekiella sp. ZYFB001 TaxID=2719912 RepID=UPI001430AA3D|nr:hypothetical protein [Leeuwenhoekiella sp. ZYFB001]